MDALGDEWLASRVLECFADPRAVCRLALVNKNFSVASSSDLLWQRLLPPAAILNPLLAHVNFQPLSKKHLFIHLCKSITYDQGLKKFWLDPTTGGECHMISAKALSITYGSTPQYWQWPYPGSMFSEVACLCKVSWFDVRGTFQYHFRPGRYMISFRLQLRSNQGWQGFPVKLCIQNTTYAHPPHESEVLFEGPSFKIRPCPPSSMFATSPKQATCDREGLNKENVYRVLASSNKDPHIWVECDVGEFFVEDDNENRPIEVNFSMQELKDQRWRRRLFLDGVIIRPSYVVDNIVNDIPT